MRGYPEHETVYKAFFWQAHSSTGAVGAFFKVARVKKRLSQSSDTASAPFSSLTSTLKEKEAPFSSCVLFVLV